MDKSFLGNLTYNAGQDFNVVISNASFDELKSFKDWAQNPENGGTTYNGLGTNIKNCFIVCSPQVSTSEVNISTDLIKQEYYEKDGIEGFTDGDEEISTSKVSTSSQVITKRDNGCCDLIVTDHLGNLIRLTPPFVDIDTDYFSVKNGIVTEENDSTQGTMYGGRALTFNDKYKELLKNSNTVIDTLSSTYTPILNTIDSGVGDQQKKYITYAYSYTTNNAGQKITWWNTVSFDTMNVNEANKIRKELNEIKNKYKDNYEEHVVSWVGLINENKALKERVSQLEWQLNPKNENGAYAMLDNRLRALENAKYIYKATSDTPTYIWAGTAGNYSEFIKDHQSQQNTYIFIHTPE